MQDFKKFMICWITGVVIVAVLSYIVSLHDDIYIQQYYEGLWYKDILNSFRYFVEWILPYSWLIIVLIGTILGAVLFLITLLLNLLFTRNL